MCVFLFQSKNQQRNYVDQFVRNISKLQELIDLNTPGQAVTVLSKTERDRKLGGKNWAWQVCGGGGDVVVVVVGVRVWVGMGV